jgi:cobalt-zinc-cadmium efflux system protein
MAEQVCDQRSVSSGRVSPRVLAGALALTVAFVMIEAAAGWYGHSLALLSDAGHNLADVAALGLSSYALIAFVGVAIRRMRRRHAGAQPTTG